MKEIELTPKAGQDLESIWEYTWQHFGMAKADDYIGRISDVFDVLATHQVGVPRAELGEHIFALPVEQHVIFFLPSETRITIIRILSHSQDSTRHFPWR